MKRALYGMGIFVLFCLTACQGSANQNEIFQNSLADIDLVISAQQGRISTLEKEVKELKSKLNELSEENEALLETTLKEQNKNSTKENGNSNGRDDHLRILFLGINGSIDSELLEQVIKNNDQVYKMQTSPLKKQYMVWITDSSAKGDLYLVEPKKGSENKKDVSKLSFLGTFSSVHTLEWSPNGDYAILETKQEKENSFRGHLLDTKEKENRVSFDYADTLSWGADKKYFVYIAFTDDIYVSNTSKNMHTTGIFVYDIEKKKFEVIDSGQTTYRCVDLEILKNGDISYTREYANGNYVRKFIKRK